MRRIHPTLLASLALAFVTPFAIAQSQPTPRATATPTRPSASAPQTQPPAGDEGLSQELSNVVSEGIRFDPTTPPTTVPESTIRDPDRPRNDVIRLPRHMVLERPPVFTDRALHSPENLRKLASDRHFSSFSRNTLNGWRLPFYAGAVTPEFFAMELFLAEERKRNIDDMLNRADLYRKSGDEPTARAIEAQTEEIFMRRADFGVKNGSGR